MRAARLNTLSGASRPKLLPSPSSRLLTQMDVIAGAANSSSETKADGSAAAAEANGAMPTAEVRTCITAAANAETDGSVTAAAKAKTHAVTSTPASAAHRRLSCGQCRQREGKRCRGRQK